MCLLDNRRPCIFLVHVHSMEKRGRSVVCCYAVVDFAAGSNERIPTQAETEVGEVVLFVPVEDFLRGRFSCSMNWFKRTRVVNLNQTPNDF